MDLKDSLRKICTILKEGKSTSLCDCNDNKVYSIIDGKIEYLHAGKIQHFTVEESEKIKYFATINHVFCKTHNIGEKNLSVIWILVGCKDGEEKVLQVGRNKNLQLMLREISIDTHKITADDNNKYSKLDYNTLSFYQVDIDHYLDKCEDIYINQILNPKAPQDEALKSVYYNVKAAYVEGKLASLQRAELWHSSGGIDGDIYQFYKA